MNNYSHSVQNAFGQRRSLIIIGLTGRTGSGCSTTADILKTEFFDDLHLKNPKTSDFKNRDERKYEIIYKYMQAGDHWQPFTVISGSNIIFSFILEKGFERFLSYISRFKNVDEMNDVRISAFDEVKNIICGMKHMFSETIPYNVEQNIDHILTDPDKVELYYKYYLIDLPKHKKEFYDAISNYTCHREYVNRFEQT